MKIRDGFVSNSSSSSFVCDVCGIAESGMDASASDFDMNTCCNGHTFCNCHAEDLYAPNHQCFRKHIEEQIKGKTWMNETQRNEKLKELEKVEDDNIEDFYNDNYSDDGVLEAKCPICSMKFIRDVDGFAYLKKKFCVTDDNILSEIKTNFKSYKEFFNTVVVNK